MICFALIFALIVTAVPVAAEGDQSQGQKEEQQVPVIKYTSYTAPLKIYKKKKKKKAISLNDLLPKKYRKKFVVAQGGETDGKYAYQVFEHHKTNKCIILKYNVKTFKKVKVSKPLLLDHGNDIAYNPYKKLLYVVHWDGRPMRISVVNPKTLKIVKKKTIKLKMGVPGVTEKEIKRCKSLASITFEKSRRLFAVRISKHPKLLMLDESLNPVKLIDRTGKLKYTPQTISSDSKHIYLALDNKGKANKIMAFDWEGKYEYTMHLKRKFELENIFCVGGQWRATMFKGLNLKMGKKRKVYVYKITTKKNEKVVSAPAED